MGRSCCSRLPSSVGVVMVAEEVRLSILDQFFAGALDVLVCTDLMSRGFDCSMVRPALSITFLSCVRSERSIIKVCLESGWCLLLCDRVIV